MELFGVYIKNTIDLVRSIIIKSEDTAIQINNYLIASYGENSVNLNDPTTWKYYLNISGNYSQYDVPMTIESIDTGTIINFTVNDLQNNPITYDTYRNNRELVSKLIDRYPTQELLIRGILFPVDINSAINAKDHQILYYNANLVEEQEYDFLHDLQLYLFRYRDRWYVRGFTVSDNLYLTTYFSLLYTNLVSAVMNIRSKYSNTYQAHSFFIYHYMESHHRLSYIINKIDKYTLFFLYKNLNVINRKVGMKATLTDIVFYLLQKEGYESVIYELTGTSEIENDGYLYPTLRDRFYGNKTISSIYTNLDNILYKETIDLETGGLYGREDLDTITSNIYEEFKRIKSFNIPTKLLDISKQTIFTTLDIDLNRLIIDNWVYSIFTNKLTDRISYTDPNTGELFVFTHRDAFILFIMLLSRKYNITNPIITDWDCLYIVPDIDINYISKYLPTNSGLDSLLTYIIDTINSLPSTLTVNSYTNYIKNLISNLTKIHTTISQLHDDIEHGYFKAIVNRLLIPVTVSFDYTTTDIESLYDNNVYPNIDSLHYDVDKSIVALIKAVTGFELPLSTSDTNRQIVNMLRHIVAYTTQPLIDTDMRKLGNADFGFSRLSNKINNLFYPIITSDCLPANTAPMVHIECGEIYFDISTLCFDAVIHTAEFKSIDSITSVKCDNNINYHILDCEVYDSFHNNDCKTFDYISASSCECYIEYTVMECNYLTYITYQDCMDNTPIIPFNCYFYISITPTDCIDTTLHTPIICTKYDSNNIINCITMDYFTPMVCNKLNYLSVLKDCDNLITYTTNISTPYNSIINSKCIEIERYDIHTCDNIKSLGIMRDCIELPDFTMTIECVCKVQ